MTDRQVGPRGNPRQHAQNPPLEYSAGMPPNMTHAALACIECNRRKIWCNGQTPCNQCHAHSTVCNYRSPGNVDERRKTQDMMLDLHEQVNALNKKLQEQGSPTFQLVQMPTQESGSAGNNMPAPSGPSSTELNPGPQPLVADLGTLRMKLTTDPLWSISRAEGERLIRIFADGQQSVVPFINVEQVLVSWHNISALLMSCNNSWNNREVLAIAAEAIATSQTATMKLILANGLALGTCDMAKLARDICSNVRDVVVARPVGTQPRFGQIVNLVLLVILQSHLDDDIEASRSAFLAASLCLDMGLSKRETVDRNFPGERQLAKQLFWIVYILDMRSNIPLGLPYFLDEYKFDISLPERSSDPYFRLIVDYADILNQVNRLGLKMSDPSVPYASNEVDSLHELIQQWQNRIPEVLRLAQNRNPDGPNVDDNAMADHNHDNDNGTDDATKSSVYRLQSMGGRAFQLRNILNHSVLFTSARVLENPQRARQAIDTAHQSLNRLLRTVRLVRVHPFFFKHPLCSALQALVLALQNAFNLFIETPNLVHDFFHALDFFRSVSGKSVALMRLWSTLEYYEGAAVRLGLLRPLDSTMFEFIDPSILMLQPTSSHPMGVPSENRGAVEPPNPPGVFSTTNEEDEIWHLTDQNALGIIAEQQQGGMGMGQQQGVSMVEEQREVFRHAPAFDMAMSHIDSTPKFGS